METICGISPNYSKDVLQMVLRLILSAYPIPVIYTSVNHHLGTPISDFMLKLKSVFRWSFRRMSGGGGNRLGGELSPYLRQHKDNPVDWFPWGEEAIQRCYTNGTQFI